MAKQRNVQNIDDYDNKSNILWEQRGGFELLYSKLLSNENHPRKDPDDLLSSPTWGCLSRRQPTSYLGFSENNFCLTWLVSSHC